MRRLTYLSLLVSLLFAAGCVAGSNAGDESPNEPAVHGSDCEETTDCAVDDYCLDGACETRPREYDEEPGYPGLVSHEGVCRVVMYDDFNVLESTLQVEQINPVLFVVTNGVGTDYPWSVEVVLYEDGALDVAAGVPDVDYEELLEEYGLQDVGQLRFEQPGDHPCSEFERALVFFLIMEWFFFG